MGGDSGKKSPKATITTTRPATAITTTTTTSGISTASPQQSPSRKPLNSNNNPSSSGGGGGEPGSNILCAEGGGDNTSTSTAVGDNASTTTTSSKKRKWSGSQGGREMAPDHMFTGSPDLPAIPNPAMMGGINSVTPSSLTFVAPEEGLEGSNLRGGERRSSERSSSGDVNADVDMKIGDGEEEGAAKADVEGRGEGEEEEEEEKEGTKEVERGAEEEEGDEEGETDEEDEIDEEGEIDEEEGDDKEGESDEEDEEEVLQGEDDDDDHDNDHHGGEPFRVKEEDAQPTFKSKATSGPRAKTSKRTPLPRKRPGRAASPVDSPTNDADQAPPEKKGARKWSQSELSILNKAKKEGLNWPSIAQRLPGRTKNACSRRYRIELSKARPQAPKKVPVPAGACSSSTVPGAAPPTTNSKEGRRVLWTEEDIAKLRRHRAEKAKAKKRGEVEVTDEEFGAGIGRTRNAVLHKWADLQQAARKSSAARCPNDSPPGESDDDDDDDDAENEDGRDGDDEEELEGHRSEDDVSEERPMREVMEESYSDGTDEDIASEEDVSGSSDSEMESAAEKRRKHIIFFKSR